MRNLWWALLLLLSAGCSTPDAAPPASDEEAQASHARWLKLGVHEPLEFEMMRAWERQPPVNVGVEEWGIDYSPNRKFAVVYFLYERDHRPGPTTLTYFRIEDGKPRFVRHDVVPGLAHYAVGDDGTAVTLVPNYSMMTWHIRALDGRSTWGTLLHLGMSLKAAADGSFLISSSFAEYRLAMAGGEASIAAIEFHVGEKFYRGTFSEPISLLPICVSNLVALNFAQSLESVSAMAEKTLATHPRDPGALYVRNFAKEAIPILRDPAMPFAKDEPIELPRLQQLLETIVRDPDEPK
ncbi:MAG: hypothetical protein IT452_12315 [Planctomycetia bacterium]|nr:hypothetical protein [Planctomycetia bacterium]